MQKSKKKTMTTIVITVIVTLAIVILAITIFSLSIFNNVVKGIDSVSTGSYNYRIEKDSVFFDDKHIPEAESATFEQIGRNYSKDSKHVFYCNSFLDPQKLFIAKTFEIVMLENADPNSFKLISEKYGRDDKSVFYKGFVIPEADPESFREFDANFYLDKSKIFHGRSILQGADPAYFMSIGNSFYRDQKHVWKMHNELSVPNPNKVSSISSDYIKNDIAVYFIDSDYKVQIIDVNPDKFRLLNPNFYYGTEGKNVYYKNKLVPNADLGSFQSTQYDTIIGEQYPDASDKNHFYKSGNIIGKKK